MTSLSLDLFGHSSRAGKKWEKSKCPFLSLLVVLAVSGCSAMEKNVPQTPATDTVVVIAEDFFEDSAVAVSVDFQACCTEKSACKNMGFGYRLDSMLFVLTPAAPTARIPLEYARKAECPYRFNELFVGFLGRVGSHGSFGFFKDASVRNSPRTIDPICIEMPLSKAQEVERCRGALRYNLPGPVDTIIIRRSLE